MGSHQANPPLHQPEAIDRGKRRFLVAATSVLGAVGASGLVVPFLGSMAPSERAKAAGAPVEVDVSKLEPGQMIRVEWRGKPVWLVNRTEEMLKSLAENDAFLRDPKSEVLTQQPEYARNPRRSIKPELLVLVGICTHLGCSPTFRPDVAPADLGPNWKGGFYCPCHGSRFDLAGRVFQNVPAAKNLEVPPYQFVSDTRLIVGLSRGTA